MEQTATTPTLEERATAFKSKLPANLIDEFVQIEEAIGIHDPGREHQRESAVRAVCIAAGRCLDNGDLHAFEAALERIQETYPRDASQYAFDKIGMITHHINAVRDLCGKQSTTRLKRQGLSLNKPEVTQVNTFSEPMRG